MLTFLPFIAVGFALTEALSYVLHRWVFHGPLWRIHRTHHRPRGRGLELNDVFSVGFAGVAIALMAAAPRWRSIPFALGVGVTLYGALFFVVHDAYTHRRIFRFRSKNRWLNAIRDAHRHHHRDATRAGQEPYGLFWTRGAPSASEATAGGRHG